ncbi:MAG: FAD-dependent oxidoreductase [Betaproteobacteria bacterium]|nr:FAD-dependent oxidoreductase [Betaproteobacteria bacterium]
MTQFVDALSTEFDSAPTVDVCVIGAGAAGITLCTNLADSKLRVVLLESGGRDIDGATQNLYQATQTGIPYYDMTSCRLRFFGGTTNHWSGYCRENDPIDYDGWPELGVPAWPIGYKDIAPYVAAAAAQIGLQTDGFRPEVQALRNGYLPSDLLESRSGDFHSKVFQITRRRRFQELYSQALGQQSNLDVILHANVVHLDVSPNGNRLDSVTVRAFGRRPFKVHARRFVLAAHAVENARLMLHSDDVIVGGIGNESGQLGRNFMEHPYAESGLFFPSDAFPQLYDADTLRKINLNMNLSLSAQAMRRERMLQYYCRFLPLYGFEESAKALERLYSRFWEPADLRTIAAVRMLTTSPGQGARSFGARLGVVRPKPIAYMLDHRIEQSPNPASRITLSTERDALGVRKVVLNWALSELDYRTFAKGQEVVVRELSRLGAGRFELDPLTPEAIRAHVRGHYHHIGTTRMATTGRNGVVDPNGKVHGMANLYVAGSSIFPTSGYSGPTMMIIAFAIRLAEHLKQLGTAA